MQHSFRSLRELKLTVPLAVCLLGATHTVSAQFEYNGHVAIKGQLFTQDAIHEGDKTGNFSGSLQVELYKAFDDSGKSIVFTPFIRAHVDDESRSHVDIRELLYVDSQDAWEFSLGLGQIFWGVAESRNVVDIINQTDQLEGLNTDTKLGQALINVSAFQDWGTLAFYVLPGFRERAFPDADSRPRLPFSVNDGAARFESSDDTAHIDYAIRYSHFIDEWDFGLSYFSGTSREPLLQRESAGANASEFVPFYHLINQVGIDVQATLESWLLKFEMIRQSGKNIDNHIEVVTGFEYSFYGILQGNTDIGLVAEYLWDERDDQSNPFQNDLLLGLRFALNDEQSSEALLGVIADLEHNTQLLTLEANRRIGSSFKLTAEAVVWESSAADDPLFALENEDYLELELAYFF